MYSRVLGEEATIIYRSVIAHSEVVPVGRWWGRDKGLWSLIDQLVSKRIEETNKVLPTQALLEPGAGLRTSGFELMRMESA